MKVKYILFMIVMLTSVSCAQIRELILLLSGGDDNPGQLQVSTLAADNIGYTSAQVHGLILNNNYDTAVKVLWGADSTFTDSSAVDQDTLSGTGYHTVSYTITGLSGGTNYIYKFVATNSGGRREGNIKNFVTTETPAAPLLTLAGSSSITTASAYAHVTIDPNGLSSTLLLLYGTATGTYTDTLTPSPATYTGYSESEVSKLMASLSNNTTYYFVWEAANDSGTVQTDELSFTTLTASGGAPTAISNTATYDSIGATLYGAVDPNGLETTVRFLWGLSDGVWTDSSEAATSPLLPAPTGPDTIPSSFSFNDVIDATVDSQYNSNQITLSNFDSAYVSVSGSGEYKINAGSYGTSTQKAYGNDQITLQMTSSASNETEVTTTLTAGGVSDIWSITTEAGGGATGPAELAGNFTSDAFGFEDGDVDDVWAINDGGAVTISINSSTPIYDSYSCNVTQTTLQNMADRPQILFNTTSAVATSTSHTIRFSIRNNDGSNSIKARFMYLGGLVNPTDPVIAAGATEDFEITINSSSTSAAYFGLYIYEGNSYNFNIDIDNVSIKAN